MALSATYVDSSTFEVSKDKTAEFVANRRVKADCGVDGNKYSSVSSSSYDEGTDKTTVNLNDSVLTSNLNEAWFGVISPPGAESAFPPEDSIDHDLLKNYASAEHIDWTVPQTDNIHSDNYNDIDLTSVTEVSFASEYDIGTVSTDTDIDWANGNNQVITLSADITLTFSNMGVGHKQLRVIQDSTGSRTPTLPSGKWPGGNAVSFSASADAEDILSIFYNGTDYYYQLSKGWA